MNGMKNRSASLLSPLLVTAAVMVTLLPAPASAWQATTAPTGSSQDSTKRAAAASGFADDGDRLLSELPLTPSSSAQVAARCEAALALATRLRRRLENSHGAATLGNALRPYDDLSNLLNGVANEQYLVAQTHPSPEIRTAAEACVQRLTDEATALSLSRPVYDLLKAISIDRLGPTERQLLARSLLQYRLAGVDRDAATRRRVVALQKRITAAGLKFDANIRDLRGETLLDSAADLVGLPPDYIAGHPSGADGKIHISTAYPDTLPVFSYADKEATREAVARTFNNLAYPANAAVLRELLGVRAELAALLGYPDYASLITADKMIGTPQRAAAFLEDVNSASASAAARDYAELFERWRAEEPSATALAAWNVQYVANKLRIEKYQVDAAAVRQYFSYVKARNGIFQLVKDLFGSDVRPWNVPVWAPGVTAWELYDGDTLVGRFFLDPYPRAGKYNHAAEFPLRTGIADRAVPMAALVTNFPESGPMEHRDVETFLHEFGHLLHQLYSGKAGWALANMGNLEGDFIEAPSQMLEEWVWNDDTLARFATNDKGEAIPADLVARMNRARHFGEALSWKRQVQLSAISLAYHQEPPATLDFDRTWAATQARYVPIPPMPGVHPWAGFGHLNGYSAVYYTYVWSKAIALDLFTRFEGAGVRDPATARDYRRLVLEPGAQKPAGQLVEDFLGRPLSLDAFRRRLEQ